MVFMASAIVGCAELINDVGGDNDVAVSQHERSFFNITMKHLGVLRGSGDPCSVALLGVLALESLEFAMVAAAN